MKRTAYRSILTLVVAGLVLAVAPNAVAAHKVGAPIAVRAQSGPTFVFPSSGQTFPLNGSMLFQVQSMSRAQGYVWSFVQNGTIVWQNLAWDGRLGGTTYSVGKGSRAEGHMHVATVHVWVRAWMGGNQWSGLSTLGVRLQGAASGPTQPQPVKPQPVQPTHPAPGTTLYYADASGGLDKWTGTTDWKHLNGMLTNDGSLTQQSWAPVPYQVQGTNDYAVEADIQVVKADQNSLFGISLRHTTVGDYNGHIAFHCCGDSPTVEIDYVNYKSGVDTLAHQDYDPGTDWHTYRLEVRGNQLRFLIDGNPAVSVTDNRFLTGQIAGLWSVGTQFSVRRVAVYAL